MINAFQEPPASQQEPEIFLTAEEFFAMPDMGGCELINGRVVPKHQEGQMISPGAKHGKAAARIAGRLDSFVTPQWLGDVYVETGFTLPNGEVHRPDVAFVCATNLPKGTPDAFPDVAPTIAIEVISAADFWQEIEDKVRLYLQAGAKAVWLVEPQRRVVVVRRSGGASMTYREGDVVPGGDILPDFALPVHDIFE